MNDQDEILAEFRKLPLPVRMRAADKVREDAVKEFRRRLSPTEAIGCVDYFMASLADEWERRDAEKAREAQEVEELVKLLRAEHPQSGTEHPAYAAARAVLAAGYRKTDQ